MDFMGDIQEYIDSLKNSKKFGPQVVCDKIFHPESARTDDQIPHRFTKVVNKLKSHGIKNLYSHQSEALRSIALGQNTLVATATASGKSMIYNIPVLSDLLANDFGHALYLFPLKALAQDQLKTLEELSIQLGVEKQHPKQTVAAIYDGDSSTYARRKVRERPPAVLLSNPEMVHLSMLPHHQSWQKFFTDLRYVVIDEVHCYRGVLGSHMAWVMRRLQRIAAHYGSDPQFIMSSATIGNPEDFGRELIGEQLNVISQSGAPQAEKSLLFLNPWDSAAYTAGQLLEAAVKRELRTIVYTQSRKMTELITMWTTPRLGAYVDRVSSYRAGFLPEERREIEHKLFSGDLLGVVTTSALELGIDIGNLDLCLLVGYPGSIMSTLQRGGRVGRGGHRSAIILIAQEDALDQHFMNNPDDFFDRAPESAVLNPYNQTIMKQHLQCCAAELVLEQSENLLKNEAITPAILEMTNEGRLLELRSGGQWISPRKRPEREISLRGGGQQIMIIDTDNGEVVGEIDTGRAIKECHPGAIYLHRLTTFLIEKLDFQTKEVLAKRSNPRFFTRPSAHKNTEILSIEKSTFCFGGKASFGRVRVTEQVTGYRRHHSVTHKQIDSQPLEMPEQIIETEGVWLEIPPEIVTEMEQQKYHFMGAIHALEHAMIALFPLLVLCDRNDIGGISCPLHEQTENATVFIYDGYSGGVGLSREAYNKIEHLLLTTQRTIAACGCSNGCPSCVHSPKCGSGNRPIDKQACLQLLKLLLNKESHPEEWSQIDLNESPLEPIEELHATAAVPTRYGVFDLETCRSAEEVGGWRNAHRMGVSVGIIYDGERDEFCTYLEDEVEELIAHLCSLDLIIGFNNKRFDNQVLSAYTTIDLAALPSLDLLEEVHRVLGYRLSLNRLAEVTLEAEKTADGLQALKWYKEGKIDLIRKYCREDVKLTRDLFWHAVEEGHLLFANKAGKEVRLPLSLGPRIQKVSR